MAKRISISVKTNIPVRMVPENYLGNSGVMRTSTTVMLTDTQTGRESLREEQAKHNGTNTICAYRYARPSPAFQNPNSVLPSFCTFVYK